ncbi:MAG TPA: 16S rRNA (guanine(527)-N(7))-methyltransferase RsmG [Allosphingosinicella sp.]|nr:16S rRNA (guanine(527)-N(7))-methyltransferase RsmG [Allosphingosinicella sp.]
MDEKAAKTWLANELHVPRETMARMAAFVRLLRDENERQNLVSTATLGEVWTRHIVDSAQLTRFAPAARSWLDLGTGAGFPGLIVAALHPAKVTMVEARPLRADFLRRAAQVLDLPSETSLICARIETLPSAPSEVISARAFAPLGKLLGLAERFSTAKTRWILPKGRNAQSELESVESSWHGDFRLEPSLTDADARIIVAQGVRRRTSSAS